MQQTDEFKEYVEVDQAIEYLFKLVQKDQDTLHEADDNSVSFLGGGLLLEIDVDEHHDAVPEQDC